MGMAWLHGNGGVAWEWRGSMGMGSLGPVEALGVPRGWTGGPFQESAQGDLRQNILTRKWRPLTLSKEWAWSPGMH